MVLWSFFVFVATFSKILLAIPLTCYSGVSITGGAINQANRGVIVCEDGEVCSQLTSDYTLNIPGYSLTGTVGLSKCTPPGACPSQLCDVIRPLLPRIIRDNLENCTSYCCSENLCNNATANNQRIAAKETMTKNETTSMQSKDSIRCLTGTSISGFPFSANGSIETTCGVDEVCSTLTARVSLDFFGSGNVFLGQCLLPEACRQFTCESARQLVPNGFSVTIENCQTNCCDDDLCNLERVETSGNPIEDFFSVSGIRCLTGYKISALGFEEDNRLVQECSPGFDCASIAASVSVEIAGFNAFGSAEISQCLPQRSCLSATCDNFANSLQISATVTISDCNITCCQEDLCNDRRKSSRSTTTLVNEISPQPRLTTTKSAPSLSKIKNNITANQSTRSFSSCNFNLTATATSQILNSPGWPENYTDDLSCSWTITTQSQNTFIEMTFLSFSTEICCDELKIEEDGNTYEQLKGSPGFLPSLISPADSVLLSFQTDGDIHNTGFQISYKEIAPPTVSRVLTAIRLSVPPLYSSYKNWYAYTYDGGKNYIRDGGRDMFDTANMIYILPELRDEFPILYNRIYRFDGFELQTSTGNPFLSLLWVTDEAKERTLTLQVKGDPGSDGEGKNTFFNGKLEIRSFQIQYESFQISGTQDPTICEVHFTIYSEIEWNSLVNVLPTITFNSNLRELDTRVRIKAGDGALKNALIGYVLVSRYPSTVIYQREIETVLERIAESFVVFPPYSQLQPNGTEDSLIPTSETAQNVSGNMDNQQPQTMNETDAAPYIRSSLSVRRSALFTDQGGRETSLDFLPSCSVDQAVQSVFRCEYIFANPVLFLGPAMCRNLIYEAIRCVGNQLVQCLMGGGRNELDSYNFLLLNSKTMIEMLYNLTVTRENNSNFGINMFCYHAPQNISYPYPIPNLLPFCEEKVLENLVEEVADFFYSFAWATTRNDICRAYNRLKDWFFDTVESRCDLEYFYDNLNYTTMESIYLTSALKHAVRTIDILESTACRDESEISNHMEEFRSFACPNV